MLVYGDAAQFECAARRLARLRAMLRDAASQPRGIDRHGAFVAALIEAGELAQGIADARFDSAGGRDAPSAAVDAAMALVMTLADRCAASWFSGFAHDGGGDCARELDACEALLPTGPIEIRQPEGYAFYALYPEAYLEAARARASGSRNGRWHVVGIRSIGTSLAAMVAIGLNARRPVTLRPAGHPFAREVAADAALRPAAGERDACAIVDEGPGLSGSSFASVARWLDDSGIAIERQHFFASHAQGPGAQAGDATRAIWRRAHVQTRGFDETILHAAHPAHRLQSWVEARVGRLRAPLREITGGGWRALHRCTGEDDASDADDGAPPAHPWQERRKFLAETGDGRWLVKFIGLGARGARLLSDARTLAAAGFSPAPAALCHGFLIERWHGGMRPLTCAETSGWRDRLVQRIADYLAFRARHFAAPHGSGADLRRLHEMGRHNTEQASFGAPGAAAWRRLSGTADRLARAVVRVRTDSRLHAWEWLVDGERLLKTDAIDHHAGHDLIGCQDIAWDVAGAAVEFDLSACEQRRLVERMAAHSGVRVRPELVAFYRPCYLAFQLGYWQLARDAAATPRDAARLRSACERYRAGLRRALGIEAR